MHKQVVWIIALASTLVIGAAPPGDPIIAKARAILDNELIDYPHARLRDFRKATSEHGVALCGKVNSPTRAGGMSGWQEVAVVVGGPNIGRLIVIDLQAGSLHDYTEGVLLCHPKSVRGPDGNPVVVPGVVFGADDLTPLLQPDASPASNGGFF